jgi:ADP-ribosylglycohydrolase
MTDKQKALLYGAFLGDSLALGAHWIYNTRVIDKKAGRITELSAPVAGNYHPHRAAGDFTHYGDQMLFFLNHLQSTGGLDVPAYLSAWRVFFDAYDGYKDGAMKDTYRLLSSHPGVLRGSDAHDLAGIFYVPVLRAAAGEEADLTGSVETAVRMTYDNDQVAASALYLDGVLKAVLGGKDPLAALGEESAVLPEDLGVLVRRGIESAGKETRKTIGEFGQACGVEQGLPGAVHLIATYPDNLEEALIENTMAGGDSAARGIFAGSVLGAALGTKAHPKRWLAALKAREEIERLL